MRQTLTLVAVCLGGALGCSATSSPAVIDDGGSDSTATTGAGGAGGAGSGAAGGNDASTGALANGAGGGFAAASSSTGAGGDLVAEVYGHSPNDLYKLNPLTKQVSVVGPFKNIAGAVIDIAINDKHEIYATTFEGLYTVDKQTATATLIKQGNYPNSLSFVPVGVLDPTEEVLVGYKNSTYIRISTVTGDIVTVGNLGGGLISSGDIVSVKDGVTLLTAKGSNCGDCLVEVDPKTGAMVKNHGDIGFSSVFGLAYWGGSAYGFSATGSLFEVSFGNGPVSSKVIPVPGAPADLKFWGAGSSTIAPVNPPK